MNEEPRAAWPFPSYKHKEMPDIIQMNRAAAMQWMHEERVKQMVKWSLEHDDMHPSEQWVNLIHLYANEERPTHEVLIRVGAICMAALEAHLRALDREQDK